MSETGGTPPVALAMPAPPIPWTKVAWIIGLLVMAYLPILIRMADQWSNDDDMSHGFFVPAVVAYITYQRREELLATEMKPSLLGLLLLFWSLVQMCVGILGAELFLQRSAFVGSVWGAVLYLGGWPYFRVLTLPMVMLPLMVPLPAIIYNQVTFPLQLFASAVAEQALSLLGIPVLRDGNVLELVSCLR